MRKCLVAGMWFRMQGLPNMIKALGKKRETRTEQGDGKQGEKKGKKNTKTNNVLCTNKLRMDSK